MKNILVSLLLFSLFLSCDSKNSFPDKISDSTYSFVKIEYYAREDSKEITTIDSRAITYSNGTKVEQKYSFNPFEGFAEETVFFQSNEIESFHIKGVEVFVPVLIDESNTIYLGTKKWEYSRDIQQEKYVNNFSMDVIIPPNTTATASAKLFFNTYKANYKFFMKGDQTGKEIVVEGIWTGVYADHFEDSTSFVDL